MDKIRIDSLRSIRIARLADAEVDCVVFDVSPWREAYPALTDYRVEVTSPGGIVYFPVKVALDGDDLTWTIAAEDTASAGDGLYQIVATGTGGEHKTSASAAFAVRLTMPGTAEDTPPDPAKPWVDEVVRAARKVEDATVHPPIIGENGNWMLWDFDAAAYVDSGKPSQGGGSGGGGIAQETDPTVPAWAKQPNPPTYTAQDVGARPADWLPTLNDIGAASAESVDKLSEEIVNQGEAIEGKQPKGDYALRSEIPVEGEYELIETIIVKEPTALIERTVEPNGKPYSFKKLYIKTHTKRASTGSSITYGCHPTNAVLCRISMNHINTTETFSTVKLECENGFFDAECSYGTSGEYQAMAIYTPSYYNSMNKLGRIEILRIIAGTEIPAESTFEIMGVRA